MGKTFLYIKNTCICSEKLFCTYLCQCILFGVVSDLLSSQIKSVKYVHLHSQPNNTDTI